MVMRGRRVAGPGVGATSALVESAESWSKVVGKELQAAAPGAIQGALSGFMTGGPYGAALGAVAGGVGSAVASHKSPQPNAVAPGGDANIAAVQLLAALLRPEVVRALGAIAMGPSAAPASVSVAGTQVPVAAFANMISTLAGAAAAQHHVQAPPSGGVPAYLAGQPAATPQQRAEVLLSLLHEAATEPYDEDDEPDDWDDDWNDELDEAARWNDALMEQDLADLARLEFE
jgi:hypothetical protein